MAGGKGTFAAAWASQARANMKMFVIADPCPAAFMNESPQLLGGEARRDDRLRRVVPGPAPVGRSVSPRRVGTRSIARSGRTTLPERARWRDGRGHRSACSARWRATACSRSQGVDP